MGDMNANVGINIEGFESSSSIGQQGTGERNENEEYFFILCKENNSLIAGNIFQHRDTHKLTLKSRNNKIRYQIDHVAINWRWNISLQDVRAARRAVVGSNYWFVKVIVQLLSLRHAHGIVTDILMNLRTVFPLCITKHMA